MKKEIINLVMFILFVILVGIYLFIKIKPFQESDKIFGDKVGSIIDININLKDEEILFSKEDNQWVMIKPNKYKINEKEVVKLENIINNLSLERFIEKEAVDLTSYGLDKPTMIIKIKLKSGLERSLIIGEETVSKTQYYATRQFDKSGKNKVFTVSKGYIDVFSAGSSNYRDRSILCVDLARLEKLYFVSNIGKELKLEINKNTDNEWEFVAPVKAKVKSDAFVELLRNIGRLEIEEYIKIKTDDLTKYGLKKPLYKLMLKDSDGRFQFFSFGKNTDNKMYIIVDNLEEIYVVSENVFNPEDIQVSELLNVTPLSVGIDNINKIIINDLDSKYEFERDKSGQGDSFSINGQKVSNEIFTTLYVNIMALSAEGYDNSGYMKNPDFTITLDTKDVSKEIKAGFTKRSIDTYFMILNDVPLPFYIKKNKIELVRSWIKRILISG